MAQRVIDTLGIETSATHMEWFYGPKGLRFSEIGCRPPGVCTWDLYAAANDYDIYRQWAMAVMWGKLTRTRRGDERWDNCTSSRSRWSYCWLQWLGGDATPLWTIHNGCPFPPVGSRPTSRGRIYGQCLGTTAL